MRRNASQVIGRSERTAGFRGQNYADIVKECKAGGRLFEDPEFRAVDDSVFFSKSPVRAFEWKRPKEICANPQYIFDGASRFDVQQGMLGNSWMVAALASLTRNRALLDRVIFPEQSFSGPDYVGCFKFQFYYQGEWKEVVVDDRLPTYSNKLVFQHSESRDEFWSALLEKAYAKIKGSYEGLKGGQTAEAMVDFTGGVVEPIDLKDPNLFQYMLKANQRGSLLGCSISAAPHEIEAKADNGLIKGHAYSITDVRKVEIKTSRMSRDIAMVRVRNPWGNEREWTGAWSDKSREWSLISTSERENIGLTFEDDGEFWMSYDDWKKNFNQLEICNLGPDSLKDSSAPRKNFEGKTTKGEWIPRVSAGGCRNFPDTFHINPQIRVTVKDCDDDDDKGTLVVSLMQLEKRREKQVGGTMLTIGYAIYKTDDSTSNQPLPKDFFLYNKSDDRSPTFTTSREVTGRHNLVPGTYVIVPSTFDPNMAGKFLLRTFTEKESETSELGEETMMMERKEEVPETEMDRRMSEALMNTFEKVAGVDKEIDAFELKDILNAAFSKEFNAEFSTETCKSMVAMLDDDVTGKLGFSEFKELWADLRLLKGTFKKYDADGSGTMNSYELRQALQASGSQPIYIVTTLSYRLSNGTFTAAVMRYSNKAGYIEFDDFVLCLVRLKTMFATFIACKEGSKAEFSLDEFIKTTLYS